jgi:hypothetical protein
MPSTPSYAEFIRADRQAREARRVDGEALGMPTVDWIDFMLRTMATAIMAPARWISTHTGRSAG